jgi:hypothetical protein
MVGVTVALLTVGPRIGPAEAVGATYYVSNRGADGNDGKSEQAAWRTMARVNTEPLRPGDKVLFRRGDTWRERLAPRSGDQTGSITYGAYGCGDKPILFGSVKKNKPSDWRCEGGNIWATVEPAAAASGELLQNPSFSQDAAGWNLYTENGASAEASRDASDYDSAPAGYRIRCMKPGKNGSDIQFYTGSLSVKAGRLYRLSFRAKCTAPFTLHAPGLIRNGPPWDNYASGPWPGRGGVGTEWCTHVRFYRVNKSAQDARLDFYFGRDLPEGAMLRLDTLSFGECPGDDVLTCDVGNIIFDHEASCGVKVFNEPEMNAQGKFWYDEERHVLKLYSTESPAARYKDIECALTAHIIDQSNRSYVTYENLALRYGAAHGIGGANTHHIIIRDCDFSYIGGGDQMGGEATVRYGNGVEFWANAHDNLVERCRLWEVYDAALTHQSGGPHTKQYNITYRNNIIWNSEYSFEYWNRPEDSETHHIYFENNTCLKAGHGWGHTQRPDPSGRHLCFYTSPAAIRDFYVRNNIFYEAKGNAFYAPGWSKAQIDALIMNNNCWYQAQGTMISFKDARYTMAQFPAYQSAWNKEARSIVARPGWVDLSKGDLHLTGQSPCIDAGADVGIKSDYEGNSIPHGRAPDIGAYEFCHK